MKVTIRHWKNGPEAAAIEAFCKWQKIACETIESCCEEVMGPSKGSGRPVIYSDYTKWAIAVGFCEFHDYLQKNGMVLC
jgi:hypothetical protein